MTPISKAITLTFAIFVVSGLATTAKNCVLVWKTVTNVAWETVDVSTALFPDRATTIADTEIFPTATVAAQIFEEEEATISTSVTTLAPTKQGITTSVEPVVH